MKTITMIGAILKGFIRNYRSVLLIIVVPLLIVMSIFLAFGQEGVKGISVGYSHEEGTDIDINLIEGTLNTFTIVNRYYKHNDCMSSLRSYDEYVCINIKGEGPYYIDIVYDNTREPIIWEIIERMNQAFIIAQQKYSREMTEAYLSAGKEFVNYLEVYDNELNKLRVSINKARYDIAEEKGRLSSTSDTLESTLNEMERDIIQTRALSQELRRQVNEISHQTHVLSNNLINQIIIIPVPEDDITKQEALDHVYYYRSTVNYQLDSIKGHLDSQDRRLDSYNDKVSDGRRIHHELGLLDLRLNNMIRELYQYSNEIEYAQEQLRSSGMDTTEFAFASADNIVRPIRTENRPAYVPVFTDEEIARWSEGLNLDETLMRGISLISLQTIYPTMLMLITMFLSLLISTFITLSSINSRTYIRLKLVKNFMLSHFLSLVFSSLLVILIPVSVVLLIGETLFKLNIIGNLLVVISSVILLSLIIILVGIIIALLIRKESIALTTSTFIFIVMIFYSGFLLSIERMSDGFSFLAKNSPGALANIAFKQSVFHNLIAYNELLILLFQFIILFIIALIIKLYRK